MKQLTKRFVGIMLVMMMVFTQLIPATTVQAATKNKKENYTVTFETNGGSEISEQIVTKTQKVVRPDDPVKDGYTFENWYRDKKCKKLYNFSAAVTKSFTLYAKWTEGIDIPDAPDDPIIDESKDSDNDGLLDSEEKIIGTDPLNPDTDADELSDFEEILLGTDPLTPNTYDKILDTDGDGITDIDEATLHHTDPFVEDTDGDGLSDYDELFTYMTDPLKVDTDGDTLSDKFEIDHGLDPNKASSDGIHNDSEVEVSQSLDEKAISSVLTNSDNVAKPSLHGDVAGELSEKVFLATASDTAVEDNRAIIGKPVYVDGDNSYVSGLTLDFDLSTYEGSLSSLIIVKLDDDGNYVPVDSTLSGSLLSTIIDGNGTFFVLDIDEFLASLDIDTGLEPVAMAMSVEEDFSDYPDDENANTIFVEVPLEAAEPEVPEDIDASDEATTDMESDDSSDDLSISSYSLDEETDDIDTVLTEVDSFDAEIDVKTLSALNTMNAALLSSTVSGQADIVFAIDTTGSMSSTINNVVTNVTSFATTLAENYNVKVNYALIDFKDLEEDGPGTTKVIKNGSSNWFSDVNTFTSKVKTLVASGGGDTPECDIDALETARRLNWRTNSSKFIILITDTYYKNANDYGIGSMDEEIALLTRDGINTSVVTSTSYQSTYAPLYEATGGIFANISSSSFSSSLLALADLIGEQTSNGTWAILKHGYKYVKLTDEADQDGDGLSTSYELGTTEEVDLSLLIKAQLALHGVPYESYSGKTSITMYNAKSDPTKADTDDDGINDKDDTAPWSTGLKGGVVGTLSIVSCYTDQSGNGGWSKGHSFLVFNSYVKDRFDFSKLVAGCETSTGSMADLAVVDPPSNDFAVTPGSYMSLGGFQSGFVLFQSSSGEGNGVYYNYEFYSYNKRGVTYLENAYLTKDVTYSQMHKLESYCSQDSVNLWSAGHNCSTIACDSWNHLYDTGLTAKGLAGWGLFDTPTALKNSILKQSGSQTNYKISAIVGK